MTSSRATARHVPPRSPTFGIVGEGLARHPDVHVRNLGTAAELFVFTVETNTHKLMADPQTIPVESFESELVDMITRYLRGDQ